MHPQYPRPTASLVKGRWHGAAVTEGFRPQESCPKNGIPQSASLTAPFNKGAKGRGDGLPRRGFAPPRNDSTGGGKDPPLRGFSPIFPNSTKRAIISSAHGYALALPVFGRREAPSSGGGRNFFPPPLHRRGVMQMVTYSDLIQIGILVVSIINLFLNSKKK